MPAGCWQTQETRTAERIELETPRLKLRAWHDEDLDPLAQLCADPEVMRYYPAPLSRDESAALLVRCRLHFIRHGFGLWALERKDSEDLIGFCGVAWSTLPLPFAPAVELGWRLACAHWGQGLAHEAAQAVLACAFERLDLPEVVACIAQLNEPSRQLLEALGMQADAQGRFEHPGLPPGHPLRRHLLYRQRRADRRGG